MRLGLTVAYARVHFDELPSLEHHRLMVEWAASERFVGVEFAAFTLEHFSRDFSDPDELRRLGDWCRAKGVAVSAFEAGFLRHMTVSENPQVRRQAVTELARSLRVARALGTDLVYLHSAPHPEWVIEFKRLYDEFTPPARVDVPATFSWDAAWEQYVAIVREMAQEAEGVGMRLALEIRPYEMISNADGIRRLVDAVGSPALGLVFDTTHFVVQKELLPVAIEKLRDRIFLVHLADSDGCNDHHWAPGRGVVPWDGVVHALRKIGYAGFANVDVAGSYEDIDSEIRTGLLADAATRLSRRATASDNAPRRSASTGTGPGRSAGPRVKSGVASAAPDGRCDGANPHQYCIGLRRGGRCWCTTAEHRSYEGIHP